VAALATEIPVQVQADLTFVSDRFHHSRPVGFPPHLTARTRIDSKIHKKRKHFAGAAEAKRKQTALRRRLEIVSPSIPRTRHTIARFSNPASLQKT